MHRTSHTIATLLMSALIFAALVAPPADLRAQQGGGGRGQGAAPAASAAAPIDLTGHWVAVVNEEWRWRMVTPPKGDYASVPLTPEGRKVADTWTESMDGRCEAYGAVGLMRMPTRLHISWENSSTLKIETDAGQQTRRLLFDRARTPSGPRTLQGYSVAEWQRPAPAGRGAAPPPGGSLRVVTTHLRPGWLRRNGVPYSENAVLTEHFDRFATPDGAEWLVVTAIVNDPRYLTQEFVTSSHFRREPDGSRWAPTPCRGA